MTDTEDTTYDGTRGYSGSSSSKDAAQSDLVKGVTAAVQRYVLILAEQAGPRGVTAAEAREKNGTLHHGRVSSALTKMHIAGKLVALTERRGHGGIYVLPEHVNGRETRPYRRAHRLDVEDIEEILVVHQSVGGWRCQCGVYSHDPKRHRRHVAEMIAEALR